jgi:peptidoglycan/LPS O-acetylase OafA/YrhL
VTDRLKSFDGLRAISVAGVFFSGYHWLLPAGWTGVLVFYVLSGLLISRILVKGREDESEARVFFGRFYFRRTLRIFPLYFAYLILLELTHAVISVPDGWSRVRPFAWLYAVNIGMVAGEVSSHDAWGHLWTLSVEEQFYLVWPLVVWALSRRALLRVAIALVVLGPLIRYATMQLFDWTTGQLYVSSLSHLDAFALGTVLAIGNFDRVRKVLPLALGAFAVLLVIGLAIVFSTGTAIRTFGYPEGLNLAGGYLWAYTPLNLVAGLFILAAMRGELPILGTPVLAHLGKISYCIYLVQRPIKGIYLAHLEPIVLAMVPSQKLALVIGAIFCLGASVAVAALSFRIFEAPILAWRDRKSARLFLRDRVEIDDPRGNSEHRRTGG